jgi:hypothetical protein
MPTHTELYCRFRTMCPPTTPIQTELSFPHNVPRNALRLTKHCSMSPTFRFWLPLPFHIGFPCRFSLSSNLAFRYLLAPRPFVPFLMLYLLPLSFPGPQQSLLAPFYSSLCCVVWPILLFAICYCRSVFSFEPASTPVAPCERTCTLLAYSVFLHGRYVSASGVSSCSFHPFSSA